MISPTDQQVHCWAWLKKHMPLDSDLLLEDVTWKYTGTSLRVPQGADPDLSELEAWERLAGYRKLVSDTS